MEIEYYIVVGRDENDAWRNLIDHIYIYIKTFIFLLFLRWVGATKGDFGATNWRRGRR